MESPSAPSKVWAMRHLSAARCDALSFFASLHESFPFFASHRESISAIAFLCKAIGCSGLPYEQNLLIITFV
eukprot:scaffold136346_cov175-Phaeocystis_antarctica.AAC.1